MCMSLISKYKSKEKGGHRRMGVMDSSSNSKDKEKDNDKEKDKRWSQTHTSAPRHRLQLPEFQAAGVLIRSLFSDGDTMAFQP